jgi:hypothetical protein
MSSRIPYNWVVTRQAEILCDHRDEWLELGLVTATCTNCGQRWDALPEDDGTRMTEDEARVMDLLIEAHDAYGHLVKQHPSDMDEWVAGIHFLQGLLAIRVVRRDPPEGWFHNN